MPFWHRLLILAGAILAASALAKLLDRRLARRPLDPEAVTRYRVLRRTVMTTIVAVGLLSGLLAIPQVRAIAGGLLASSAVLGLVIGFAARSTLANGVAGVLIAFTQPVRLGDQVEVAGAKGTVEEIGLTYTFIRTPDNARLVIPNEKLASDTIVNATIVSREKLAEVTVQVPLDTDLGQVVDLLERALEAETDSSVLVSGLDGQATITLRARAADQLQAERLASELRLRVHRSLHAAGVFG